MIIKYKMDDSTSTVTNIHNVEEMRSNVVLYGELTNEIKKLKERSRELNNKRKALTTNIKTFMRFNQLSTCHISKTVPTDIRRIKFIEKESKQRITIKMIEQYFEEFFNSIDHVKFINLDNSSKTKTFFDFLESKRERTILESIIIK